MQKIYICYSCIGSGLAVYVMYMLWATVFIMDAFGKMSCKCREKYYYSYTSLFQRSTTIEINRKRKENVKMLCDTDEIA